MAAKEIAGIHWRAIYANTSTLFCAEAPKRL